MIKSTVLFIGKEEIDAVTKVLESGMLAQGPVVEKLEKNFAKFCGVKYVVALNSGTAALHTVLHSLGIGPGDEVITTAFSFVATANSILMVGAKPVFVDIEPDTFNINPKLIEAKITKKTKAIIAVDLYGQPANYNEINKIAKKHKLFVIEDAAQSIGARYYGKMSGNLADIACFSLYASKNIISGEGGMIATNNKNLDYKARLFRHHGQDEKQKYVYLELGYNYRMTDLQAAIAVEQLKRAYILTRKRQEIAKTYDKEFKRIKGLTVPLVAKNTSSAYHQYTLRVTRDFKMGRDDLKDYLEKKGIQATIYYPTPLYKAKHLNFTGRPKDFPITEKAIREILSIPVHPKLTDKDITYIINTIKKI